MRLSAKDYIKRYNSGCDEYIMRHLTAGKKEIIIEGGFLNWENNPEQWSGPWMGNFVFYVVSDHSKEDLVSEDAIKSKYIEYVMSSRYSYPSNIINKCFTEDNFICFVNGQKCSRSELTMDERREIMANMSRQEIMDLSISIKNQIRHFHNVEIKADVCKERPFKIFLVGTDDTSYSKTFATKEEALSMLAKLEQTSSWDIIFKDFVFTN